MGIIADTARAIRNKTPPVPIGTAQQWSATPQYGYLSHSRAYMRNEIVFASIEMLATSAGEPHIIGRRWQRSSPQFKAEIRNEEQRLRARGVPLRDIYAGMIANGFYTDLPNHPLIRLLNNPNPWMSREQLWGTVVMDLALAGNSYLVKARVQDGPLKGAVAELWRLRPDRVRVIPDAAKFIGGYEYRIGSETVTFPPGDIIQFKTRNPLNDYYGMPPLMAIAGRVDIDEHMRTFLQSFFERGGTGPGSILSVKQKLSDDAKSDIRERFKRQFGGPSHYHELMILEGAESTYQQMGLNRGLRDALPKELDAMTEARIAMVFGIPGSILGLLIGYEMSSYANKKADREVFWKITMAPKLSGLDDVLNLQLVPEFGGIDEVFFDLSDIEALQEEVDKAHARARDDFLTGGCSLQEYREAIGKDPDDVTGIFYVPANLIPTDGSQLTERGDRLGQPNEPKLLPAATEPVEGFVPASKFLKEARCPEPDCNKLLGKNIALGSVLWCSRCKSEVTVGEPKSLEVVPSAKVQVFERDEAGRIERIVETHADIEREA